MPPVIKEVNRELLVAKLAELFLQLRIIPESTIIYDIQFPDGFGNAETDLIKMKVLSRKEQGVKVIDHTLAKT